MLLFALSTQSILAVDLTALQHKPTAPAYREDSNGWLGYLARALGVAVVLAGAGVGLVVLARKYFPTQISALSSDGTRLKVLERLRLTPKTSVFILEYQEQKVLLAIHGESVSLQRLDSNSQADKTGH